MWIIALHRIQDRSEQALDHLKGEVARIDLSAYQGEDVEYAIRLIKSTYRVLKCSSTQTRFSSLPGRVQDMPPRCLHMSNLLHCLLVDNSAGVNLDEPKQTVFN